LTASSGVSVRRLGKADSHILEDLRLRALRDAPRAFLTEPGETSGNDKSWVEMLSRKAWFAAFAGREPIGLASMIRDPDTDDPYIESMWVEPGYRSQGVAVELLVAIEAAAAGLGKSRMLLWVLDGNDAARRFYRSVGFRATGRLQRIGPGSLRVEEEFVRGVGAPGLEGRRPAGARRAATPVSAAR
jgi:GNAT superfamily N-acetyltransferase